MTLTEALNLKPGDYIHHASKANADFTPMRARVTSIKTWKKSPGKVTIKYKRGMREHGEFNETELEPFLVGYGDGKLYK